MSSESLLKAKRVAVIGLGQMGIPMAANLTRAGYEVIGHDLHAEAARRALAADLAFAPKLETALEGAGWVISMLPSGAAAIDVAHQAMPLLPAGSTFIDCSTIDVADARAIHALGERLEVAVLDAPVSGGVVGAERASLTFMVGGSSTTLHAVKPLFDVMGNRIVYCGEAGAGQAGKICNQLIAGTTMLAVCEAFLLARSLGLSDTVFFDVASGSSGNCWALTTQCPVPGPVASSPANRDYAPGFATALMLKDLRLGQAAADSMGVATPVARLARDLYAQADSAGLGGKDFSAMINWLAGLNGVQPARP